MKRRNGLQFAYLLTALKFTLSLSELTGRSRLSLTAELFSRSLLGVETRMPNPDC